MIEISLRGKPFYVHDNEDLSNAIIRNGDYWEADILDYLAEHYPKHGTILDIGANIGNHSHYFSNYLTYNRLVCFEPDVENFTVLTKNMTNADKAVAFQIAVSDHTGITHLARNNSNWGAHEVQDTGIEVACTRLDSEFYNYPITLLKIDVEWHEPQVLEGAKYILRVDRPLILIEDTNRQYQLLPELQGYTLLQSWEHHNTYLYGWIE